MYELDFGAQSMANAQQAADSLQLADIVDSNKLLYCCRLRTGYCALRSPKKESNHER